VRTQTAILGLTLAGAAALWYWSRRTAAGQSATDAATGATLDFIDVAASRIESAVTSRGYRNNNPGNIRFIARNAWNGQIGNDGGYGVYDTMQNGTRAIGRQLRAYSKRGLRTVRDIIATWAPNSENNTYAYIADVSGQLGIDPGEVFEVEASLPELARAIAKHENGYIDSAYNWEWANL
jgi:type II secretory pathway pseudopilin PulG